MTAAQGKTVETRTTTTTTTTTTSTTISLLTFIPTLLFRVVLMPLRLTPYNWTAIRLHFSPAAAASTNNAGVPPLLPNLADLIQRTCPSLSKGHFRPTPLLPSGHLQTIYSAAANTVDVDVVHYKRRTILVPDGGTITLDITPPELADDDDAKVPTIIALHGLTGGSHESYVRNALSILTKPKEQGGDGYRGVVVNFRGCANTPVTSPQLYSASKTSDMRCAVLFATHAWPDSPLVGLGFSLGANVLAKYLGEEGDATPLRAGMPIGTPWDLLQGSRALESGLFASTVYSRVMSSNLTRVISRHFATLHLHQPMRAPIHALLHPPPRKDNEEARDGVRPRTLRYVDDTMTRLGGGHSRPHGEFPFDKADDYYTHGGAVHFMQGVRRPMLVLNADDDPIVPEHILEGVRDAMGLQGPHKGSGNGNVVLAVTRGGGHLGWWAAASSNPLKAPRRWLHEPVGEFVRSMLSSEATEAGLDVAEERSAWKQGGRVEERRVHVELLDARALPSYEVQIGSTEHVEEEDDVVGSGARRVAWLRTKVLLDAPLVHPSDAPMGWKEPAQDEVERFESVMYCDTQRPEVGFLELAPSSLVAGTGDTFQGGKGVPGQTTGEGKRKKEKGLVAGL